ncbi:LOW QUALITY PROTEIN: UBN2 domain-containing protein, partial [Cephalotus follicularis]
HQYELFMMHNDENISDMFTHFTTIINSLKNLRKSYSNQKLVRKILRCLSKSWTPKKFLRQQRKKPFKKHLKEGKSSKREEVICYECNKPRHYKNECPKLKNKEHSKKKKAMMATWSDSDDSNSDEESNEEIAHIAFMTIEKEEEDEVQFSFDELQSAYETLFYEYENVNLKNRTHKKNVLSLSKENESLKN